MHPVVCEPNPTANPSTTSPGYRPAGRVVAAVFEVVWPGWLAWAPPCVRRRLTAVCSYVGEVDEEGRPHGFGEWRSSTYHGEHLRWAAGTLVGRLGAERAVVLAAALSPCR